MGVYAKIAPHLMRERGRLALVVLLSGLIAVLWGCNLSTSFPAIKVLMEGQSIAGYVDAQIALNEERRELQVEVVENLAGETESSRRLRKQAVSQSELSETSYTLMVLKWVRRNVVPLLPADAFDTLALIVVVFLLGTFLKGTFVVIQEMLGWSIVHRVTNHIREETVEHLLSLDHATLSKKGGQDLVSRLTVDLQEFSYGLSLLLARMVREPLKIGVCVTLAIFINWRLTLLAFIVTPLLAGLFATIGRQFRKATRKKLEKMAAMHGTLEETFDGLKVVLVENAQSRQEAKFEEQNQAYYKTATRIAKLSALLKPLTELLAFAAVLLAFLPGAWLVLHHGTHFLGVRLSDTPMDLARLSVLYALLAGCLDPLRKFADLFSCIKKSTAAVERVFELGALQTAQPKPAIAKALPIPMREIRFESVGFSYPAPERGSARPPVLHDIGLTIRAGETVVLVGPNGCGKSTLLSLLSRLHDPSTGVVRVDGVDLTEVAIDQWRKRLGYVTQDAALLRGSIAENIVLGNENPDVHRVERAARLAGVTDFLPRLPHGLRSEVGPRGSQLSGGQRQRVALARAVYRDPSLLILDEATSAVDAASQRQIESSLLEVARGRTLVIVTHRVTEELLALDPRFVVLREGHIVGDGKYQTLLATCPVFASLFAAPERQAG